MKKRAKPDDAQQAPTHLGLSQGNAFTLPSGLSWKKQVQSRINSVTGTTNVANRRATGDDPSALRGLSKKSDENQRQRAEQQREIREAAARSHASGWGLVAASSGYVRYAKPVPATSRRRCQCGCGARATHYGMANGLALVTACELAVRRWIKTGETRARLKA